MSRRSGLDVVALPVEAPKEITMSRHQPPRNTWPGLLRVAHAVFVLLAALGGSAHPANAASNPASTADAPAAAAVTAALRRFEATVRASGACVSPEARAGTDVVLWANAKRVDDAALKNAPLMAGRLALEFRTTSRALTDERARLGAAWSEIVIAHTLAANLPPAVSSGQLVELHQGGMSWGLLAAGLGLDLSDVVNAVRIECRVANGLLPPDGQASRNAPILEAHEAQ